LFEKKRPFLENLGKYNVVRQLWLVLRVKLMEIDSQLVFQVLRKEGKKMEGEVSSPRTSKL